MGCLCSVIVPWINKSLVENILVEICSSAWNFVCALRFQCSISVAAWNYIVYGMPKFVCFVAKLLRRLILRCSVCQ
ncbi:hypothetical protein VNO78_31297 [Psophocarpus tetragonolobus]|uniref:Uncharacterized protein n=1 Tax=Psophocarpus tetragonolobus TaxID=3891 RepID=A0AAN9X7G2_PSOTE